MGAVQTTGHLIGSLCSLLTDLGEDGGEGDDKDQQAFPNITIPWSNWTFGELSSVLLIMAKYHLKYFIMYIVSSVVPVQYQVLSWCEFQKESRVVPETQAVMTEYEYLSCNHDS